MYTVPDNLLTGILAVLDMLQDLFWSQKLFIEIGILYRKYDPGNGKASSLQAIIPGSERRTVFQYCHDIEAAAEDTSPRSTKNYITG